MKPGLDGIMSIDITGMEELKECADNVIGAFITMSEAVEELSGCMLELKVSDPYENKKMESEEVDVCKVGVIESGTGMTTTVVSEKLYSKMTQDCEGINLKIQDASSEEKEVFNAEEIIEDMILKLKEKFNEKIINVETPTNQKVDVEYTGTDGTNKKATSDATPSIMLKKDVTPEPKPEEPKDNSIAPNPIPQTGDNLAFVVLGMVVLAVGIVIYIRKR